MTLYHKFLKIDFESKGKGIVKDEMYFLLSLLFVIKFNLLFYTDQEIIELNKRVKKKEISKIKKKEEE